MKVRALAIITFFLASSSVQAQDGSESMMNPMADMNPATIMAIPMKMMAEMMFIPMKMMAELMAVPMNMMEGVMAAPNAMMNPASVMNPMTVPQQTPASSYVVPAYGSHGVPAPAQAELTLQAAPAL